MSDCSSHPPNNTKHTIILGIYVEFPILNHGFGVVLNIRGTGLIDIINHVVSLINQLVFHVVSLV